MTIQEFDDSIRKIPDFPKPGILFYDVTSIFINPESFNFVVDKMIEFYKDQKIDGICGIESRGFLLAAPLARALNLPLVLIRKKGKLPGETYCCSYSLEYGEAEIEVHKSDIQKGKKYLLIDDLIATGGTFEAGRKLLEMGGAEACGFFGIIGLPALNYEEKLAPTPIKTIINFSGK